MKKIKESLVYRSREAWELFRNVDKETLNGLITWSFTEMVDGVEETMMNNQKTEIRHRIAKASLANLHRLSPKQVKKALTALIKNEHPYIKSDLRTSLCKDLAEALWEIYAKAPHLELDDAILETLNYTGNFPGLCKENGYLYTNLQTTCFISRLSQEGKSRLESRAAN